MKRIHANWAQALLIALALPLAIEAKVSSEEVAKLGSELTPLGGVKAGNEAGTIPAWEGGITTPISGYKEGDHHPDPFPEDKVLYTITSSNVEEYAEQLTPGQVAMFKRYPSSWKMNVYPTHRTAAFPEYIYSGAKENAANAELTPEGNGVVNAKVTSPFPIPQNGLEAIWNHLLRFRGQALERTIVQVAPTSSGSYVEVTLEEKGLFPYAQEGAKLEDINNVLAYFLQEITSPPYLAGNILLVHDTLDQNKEPRSAWTYNAGQRRVRRAPNIAFDTPGTGSDGQRTTDQFDMFSGSPERYEWSLIGKKEMVVPYNNYKLHSGGAKYKDIVNTGHLNPDLLRYELHRVWVVEAKLKSGTSHIYPRKVYFLDEDSWQILVADQYDSRDQIWRVSEAYCINYYEVPLFFDTVIGHYDLLNGRYLAIGLNNETREASFKVSFDKGMFRPEALRRQGRR